MTAAAIFEKLDKTLACRNGNKSDVIHGFLNLEFLGFFSLFSCLSLLFCLSCLSVLLFHILNLDG